MRPIKFPEANITLAKPEGMTDEECGPLPVFSDGQQCVSLWKMTWRERLSALFLGRVWLFVYFGSTQPPVRLEAVKTVFMEYGFIYRARANVTALWKSLFRKVTHGK